MATGQLLGKGVLRGQLHLRKGWGHSQDVGALSHFKRSSDVTNVSVRVSMVTDEEQTIQGRGKGAGSLCGKDHLPVHFLLHF